MRTHVKARLSLGIALVFLVITVVFLARPATTLNDHVAVRILRYTNDSSGLQALVQFTNSHSNLKWSIRTAFLTNGVWTRSSSQPAFDSYPPMLAANLPDFNVWIPVPPEATTWKVEVEVRPYDRGKAARLFAGICKALGIRDPFYPRDTLISSQAFER